MPVPMVVPVLGSLRCLAARSVKPAEADYVLGLGKESTENGSDNFLRYLTVSKNKIGGKHGRCIITIQPEVSRYRD
jgi:hypothetical protein